MQYPFGQLASTVHEGGGEAVGFTDGSVGAKEKDGVVGGVIVVEGIQAPATQVAPLGQAGVQVSVSGGIGGSVGAVVDGEIVKVEGGNTQTPVGLQTRGGTQTGLQVGGENGGGPGMQ